VQPRGLVGALTGMGRAQPSLNMYARHVVSGMETGAPYILSPSEGLDPSYTGGSGVLKGAFGYANLTPAVLLLHAFSMPLVSLNNMGLPILWREVLTRWSRPLWDPREDKYSQLPDDSKPLQDLEA